MFCLQSQQSLHHNPFGPHLIPLDRQTTLGLNLNGLYQRLPLSDGHDTILVVVCHLTKMALFIPTFQDIDAEDLAHIFLSQVFAKHGTPTDIISNRGKHFTSHFWWSLCQLLCIKANLSTAYHPETDSQTKRINQNFGAVLRVYINISKTIWANLLPLAEFTYNNTSTPQPWSPISSLIRFHPKLEVSLNRRVGYCSSGCDRTQGAPSVSS